MPPPIKRKFATNNWNIPLSEPDLSGHEARYVVDCLKNGWISSKSVFVDRFEHAVARYVDSPHAIAVTNGTAALHLGLLGCGVETGDEVLVPALTFIAPANAVRYCQAIPVFLDCDADTLGIDVSKLADFLRRNCHLRGDGAYNKTSKRRIRALIVVHVFGHPVDMQALLKLTKSYQIEVIEDATESLGSRCNGKQTGSLGRVGCLSFNGNKIMTTGGGGMVLTSDPHLARRVRHLSTQAKKDALYCIHDAVGYNYRLSGLQAAVGLAQLERLGQFIRLKREIAQYYKKRFQTLGLRILWEKNWAYSNFWLSTLQVPARDKEPLLRYLIAHGIQARPIWRLIPSLPIYRHFQSDSIRTSQYVYRTCINLPSSTAIPKADLDSVFNTVKKYFNSRGGTRLSHA